MTTVTLHHGASPRNIKITSSAHNTYDDVILYTDAYGVPGAMKVSGTVVCSQEWYKHYQAALTAARDALDEIEALDETHPR